MNFIEVNYNEELLDYTEKCTAETSGEHSPSPDLSGTDGINGEPPVLPRIGDEYQVEIPSLVSEKERLQLWSNLVDNGDIIDFNFCIGKESSVPIFWIPLAADHGGDVQGLATEAQSDVIESHATMDSREDIKPCALSRLPMDYSDSYYAVPQDTAVKVVELSENVLLSDKLRENIVMSLSQSGKTRYHVPLPGSPKAPWSESESQIFLLGLYIFGKNLVLVRRFVESKDMGDVLSFYYGRFYRSDAQRRWVECRKIRSRRCILGHRIFTGWRQQEFLSHLLPSRSKEVQERLVQVTKAFNEGTASLEEFIFTLKDMVGTETLVEAVGIGKGKQDLTGIILDAVKTNSVVSARPEIPAGKACSSLTTGEIVKFLTGDFRLSKAKANDLFWEAVWPRLLARGWHSEQPKDVSFLGSKNCLVFLIPGIKKFSRKKLTKGNHYFDSVSDVLNKVASDPMLLELEVEDGKESARDKDEGQWNAETADTKIVQNGRSDQQRPCYLRPRLPDCNSDFMKFTVVDTSMAEGRTPVKVRELRSLPADVPRCFRSNHQELSNSDSSNEQSSSADTSSSSPGRSDQNLSGNKKVRNSRKSTSIPRGQPNLSDHGVINPKLALPRNGHDLDDQHCDLLIDKPSIKDTKFQFSCRVKSGDPYSLAPLSKRQRLASCKSGASYRRPFPLQNDVQLNGENCFQPETLQTDKAVAADDRISEEESNGPVLSNEKSQPRTMIDLNLHPQELDSEGPSPMEVEGSLNDSKTNETIEAKQLLDDALGHEVNMCLPDEQQQPVVNGRRHSTRNRPPTAKALEALACGFLNVKKERATRTTRSGSTSTRSARRARRNAEASLSAQDMNFITPHPTSMPPSIETDDEYCRTANHMSLFDTSHVRTGREDSNDLLGLL